MQEFSRKSLLEARSTQSHKQSRKQSQWISMSPHPALGFTLSAVSFQLAQSAQLIPLLPTFEGLLGFLSASVSPVVLCPRGLHGTSTPWYHLTGISVEDRDSLMCILISWLALENLGLVWIVYVLPKSTGSRSDPQCDGTWEWDVVGVRWGCAKGTHLMIIQTHRKRCQIFIRDTRELMALFLPRQCTARKLPSVSQEERPHQNPPKQAPWSWTSSFLNCEEQVSHPQLPELWRTNVRCLSHPVEAVLLWKPKLTMTGLGLCWW